MVSPLRAPCPGRLRWADPSEQRSQRSLRSQADDGNLWPRRTALGRAHQRGRCRMRRRLRRAGRRQGPLRLADRRGDRHRVLRHQHARRRAGRADQPAGHDGGGARSASWSRSSRSRSCSIALGHSTAFNGRMLGFTALVCILAWSAAEIVTSMRLKVLYVEPDGKQLRRRERRDAELRRRAGQASRPKRQGPRRVSRSPWAPAGPCFSYLLAAWLAYGGHRLADRPLRCTWRLLFPIGMLVGLAISVGFVIWRMAGTGCGETRPLTGMSAAASRRASHGRGSPEEKPVTGRRCGRRGGLPHL